MNAHIMRKDARVYLLVVLLLWAFFAQSVTSMVVQSPTIDEQAYLSRGYLYLKTGSPHFQFGHPIFADALSALPVWVWSELKVPADDPAFAENNWPDFSERVIWQAGINVNLVFFLGRLPVVALGMLMSAIAFRWAHELWGRRAGLIALALCVFDPTIVAHSQLITHDVPLAVFYFAAAYGLWRWLRTNRIRDLLLAGITFGLAQASKFAALLLGPVFLAILGLWWLKSARGATLCERARSGARHAGGLLAILAIGGLTIWAMYHFEVRPISGASFTSPVPFATFFEDFIWESTYFNVQRYFYFCGQYGTGWWYYFPVAFLIKTPLPALLLIGAAAITLWRGARQWMPLVALLLPAGAYIVATLVSPLYIGYRYFIPTLPFLYVLAGRLATLAGRRMRLVLVGALAWSGVIAVLILPHSLSYFNELIGGPDNGWRCLTDSNIDWGQDLPALRDVVKRYQLGKIKLSYFGRAFPSYYGINFEPLPTYYGTPEQGNPLASPFYPYDPAPGVYAISVTNMRGVGMLPEKWHLYDWFLDKKPFAKAGYSLFLYRVEPTGKPADAALADLQVDEIDPKTFAALGTNDVRLRWFDASTSLVLSPEPSWYVLGKGDLAAWGWNKTLPCKTMGRQTCLLYPPDPAAHAAALASVERMSAASKAWSSSELVPLPGRSPSPLSLPVDLGNEVQLVGYAAKRSADQILLQTAWRVTEQVQGPRTIFVHLLAPGGQVVSQWDGFSVLAEGWRPGDVFIQKTSLPVPKDVAPGIYWIQLGMYNPETMQRLPVMDRGSAVADRILLESFTLNQP